MNKSFTLIEILVVIVVIGVLSAFILVGMSSITSSANIAKGKAFLNSMDNSLLLARVSQWKFDEASGTAANDSWGTNNGTLQGIAPLAQFQTAGCVFNNCLSFDGSDNYVAFTPLTSTARTQSGWFYFYQQASAAGTNKYLFNNLTQVSVNNYLYTAGADYFAWMPSLNTWYHIVLTFPDKTDDVNAKLYINAVLYDLHQQAASHVIPDTSMISSSGTASFNGKIDDVRVYNQAIPTSEIQQNYYSGLNNLLSNNGINGGEYIAKIVELRNNMGRVIKN